MVSLQNQFMLFEKVMMKIAGYFTNESIINSIYFRKFEDEKRKSEDESFRNNPTVHKRGSELEKHFTVKSKSSNRKDTGLDHSFTIATPYFYLDSQPILGHTS